MARETPSEEEPTGSEETPQVSQEERQLLDRLHGVGRWGVIWDEYPNRHNIDLDPRPPDPSVLARDVSPVNETKRPAEPGHLDQPIRNMYMSPDLRQRLDQQYGAGRWRYVLDPDLYAVLQVDPVPSPSVFKKDHAKEPNRGTKGGKAPRGKPGDEIRAGSQHGRGLNRKDGAGGRRGARDPNRDGGAIRVDPKRPAKKSLDAHPERKDLVDGETSASTGAEKQPPTTSTTCFSPVLSGDGDPNIAPPNNEETAPKSVRNTSAAGEVPSASQGLDRKDGAGGQEIVRKPNPHGQANRIDPKRRGRNL